MSNTGNETCDKMVGMFFSGNIIYPCWYKTILKPTGKADLIAINILADIVYWYKPTEIRDEITSEIIGYKKKFKSDILQKTYGNYAEMFGVSKGQITDAMNRLEKLGIIKRHFRTVDTKNGNKLGNVLFIDLIFDKLMEYSPRQTKIINSYPIPKNPDTPIPKNPDTPIPKNPETNTENTLYTENTSLHLEKTMSCKQDDVNEIISYLNTKTESSYKANSKKTISLITARFKDGFTVDDFKIVIDKKVEEWMHDDKMSKFLRPETLFGTKFESYLNQKVVNKNGAIGEYSKQNEKKNRAEREADKYNWDKVFGG